MVSAKCWVTVPAVLEAVMASGNPPEAEGVPERVAVPLPLLTKVTPAGRVPVSVRAGVGVPVVVTGKVKAVPRGTVSELALVMAGAWSMVSVKIWMTLPAAIDSRDGEPGSLW